MKPKRTTEWPELAGLLAITEGCRGNMHEPDEQGLTAEVVGTKLDNAFGAFISEHNILEGYQEMVVILRREDGQTCKINLATLIALARKAKV